MNYNKVYPYLSEDDMSENNISVIRPSAPAVTSNSSPDQDYRLTHVSTLRSKLEDEVRGREALARKYARASGVVSKAEIALTTTTLGLGAGASGY